MGLVGVAELLEGVAESSASVTGATFGLIVAAIGQIIFLSRHLVKGKNEEERGTRSPDGCLGESGELF